MSGSGLAAVLLLGSIQAIGQAQDPDVHTRDIMDRAFQLIQQQKFADALVLAQQGLDRARENSDETTLVFFLSETAFLNSRLGQTGKAEGLFIEEINLLEKHGPSQQLVDSLQNLALLFSTDGRNLEYTHAMQAAVATYEGLSPKDPLTLIQLQNNLGAAYAQVGSSAGALIAFKRALELEDAASSSRVLHEQIYTLGRLVFLYESLDDSENASKIFERLSLLHTRDPSALDWEVFSDKFLEHRAFEAGQFSEAVAIDERLITHLRSLGATETLWPNLCRLATVRYAQDEPARAYSSFHECFGILRNAFQARFAYMDEPERIEFLSGLTEQFATFYSFVSKYQSTHPAIVTEMYQLLLWQKSAVTRSLRQLRSKVVETGDSKLVPLLDQLVLIRAQIAAQGGINQSVPEFGQLLSKEDDLERTVVLGLNKDSITPQFPTVSVEDVRQQLKHGELAIEVVRYPFHDGGGWTRKLRYAALILFPDKQMDVRFVDLGESMALEQEGSELLARMQRKGIESNEYLIPTRFWGKFEPFLGTATTVYFSPDGILSQIPLAAVVDSQRRLLIDEPRDFRPLISTGDLVLADRSPRGKSREAVILGNPDFDALADSSTRPQGAMRCNDVEKSTRISDEAVSRLGLQNTQLPTTGEQVSEIATILSANGWSPKCFTGARASKTTLVEVRHPRVLHIATHGFFVPGTLWMDSGDRYSIENALTHSGLLLAGVNQTIKERQNYPADNGILTAYEASGLDLAGTELVVLSACETGLGDMATGGEVFGLRRSFQIAGAESLLMSMWRAPDESTDSLMPIFYSEWMKTNDKHLALKNAQLRVRDVTGKDLPPYYWAAFVLYGP